VGRVASESGRVEKIASAGQATHVQVDATHAYFTDWTGSVRRVPLEGGAVETIARLEYAYQLVLDDDAVYASGGGSLLAIPKRGGEPKVLAKGKGIDGVALGGEYVYWAEMNGNAIWKTPKSGGPSSLVANTSQPRALAVDATCVYWVSTYIDSNVMRAPR